MELTIGSAQLVIIVLAGVGGIWGMWRWLEAKIELVRTQTAATLVLLVESERRANDKIDKLRDETRSERHDLIDDKLEPVLAELRRDDMKMSERITKLERNGK